MRSMFDTGKAGNQLVFAEELHFRVLIPVSYTHLIRIATEQDLATQKRNEQAEKEAFDIAIDRIAEHKLLGSELDMALVSGEAENEKLEYQLIASDEVCLLYTSRCV